jgi:hypothetical protein
MRSIIATLATLALLAGCGQEPTAATRTGAKPRLTLSAGTITGAGFVVVGQACTYTANPSGGTPPYDYQWTGGNPYGPDNQQSYWVDASNSAGAGSNLITVLVTDANGATATAGKRIATVQTAPAC